MSTKSIDAIVKNTPLVVVIIGIFIFIIGAAGGWPNPSLQINELGWRIALAVLGVIISGLGGLLLWKENNFKRFDAIPDNKKYSLKVMYPNTKQVPEVDPGFQIVGTHNSIPPKGSLQFFVVHGDQYWPILRRPEDITTDKDGWTANVHIGGDPGRRTIIVAFVGPAGRALCQQFWKVGELGCWTGIDDITPFISEFERFDVTRK